MKPNGRPGAGVGSPPGPSSNPDGNTETYNRRPARSLGVDSPFVWNAVVIEIPGASEPAFNLVPDLSAHKQERCAFVKHHFEGSGLPVPDNIVVLHKARDTIESDCLLLARQMGASVVILDYASKRYAWAYPTVEQ